jgi:competence protein CoiA
VPLQAIVNGEPIIAPDLSREEWKKIQAQHRKGLPITMACCGAPGHLRISRKGTQHFYHATDTGCSHEEESLEHLEIKHRIYRACKAEGWETSVEFPAPDRSWIADVWATRDGRQIVFEIQISLLSPAELEDRDKKYRDDGIESYWLLEDFLGRAKDFAGEYRSWLTEEEDRLEETIPYIDHSLFETGPENHIFIPKGIRTAGLHAKKQTLFTTHNPEISLEDWVRHVLNGTYRRYLEETAAIFREKHRLKSLAAPDLIRFDGFYRDIVRYETYKEKVGRCYRRFKSDEKLRNNKAIQKKFREIYAEIDWLNTEYRKVIAESYGLFTWKQTQREDTSRPYFRLESEAKVKKLQECVNTFDRWEESFGRALAIIDRDVFPPPDHPPEGVRPYR